jgi:nicotinate-nucleotide pyrophosphorylase (carboxylating)
MDWNSRRIAKLIETALREDHAFSDTTTALTIDPRQYGQGIILAKQDCVLAGLGIVPRVLATFAEIAHSEYGLGPFPKAVVTSHGEIFDGVRLRGGQTAAVVRGNARQLLSCERVILNFLQRLSGIATLTRKYVEAVQGFNVRVLDTRKTIPGLRLLEKYAVTRGGGFNHRGDLSEGILIKNNHIALGGGLKQALQAALDGRHPHQPVEVEVRTLDDLTDALALAPDRILLDNMTPAQVKMAVEINAGKAELEVSGGVNLVNIRAYAETGVNTISVGALTHSAPAVDLSMRISPV